MNKAKKVLISLVIASAVGITYVVSTIKDFTDPFDWEDDESNE